MGDAVWLSRWQFGVTVGFHFIFVTLSLGLIWFVVFMEGRAWRSGQQEWQKAAAIFGKILLLTMVFGVGTGIVMALQFGTNWSAFCKFTGDIIGPPLAAEGLFAFFLESIFIGIYIFGKGRLSQGLRWFSLLMVAIGATISSFWILVVNSWMQTPAGHTLTEAKAKVELADFAQVVFNPSTLSRLFHTLDALFISGAFFVAGVGAWFLLKKPDSVMARRSVRLGVIAGLIFSVLELYPIGDMTAQQVAKTQPTKFAAMESVEKTQTQASFVLIGVPVENPPHLIYDIRLPKFLSWLAYRDVNAEIKGFDAFPPEDLPPFSVTFISFHLMVYLGSFFIGATAFAVLLMMLKKLYTSRWFLWVLVLSVPLPIIVCQLGWVTAEVGRQPWIVYGVMRTQHATSPAVSSEQVLFSLVLFSTLYLVLGLIYLALVRHEIRRATNSLIAEGK